MQPELMEGIMELVAQSCATFEARGTPEFAYAYLMRLPAKVQEQLPQAYPNGSSLLCNLVLCSARQGINGNDGGGRPSEGRE